MKKNTKSALLLSVVSIILCCTMLLGTTMAWFTDSVTSASNIIKAGNLDIKMYYLDGEEYLDVEDEDTDPIFIYDLWEPGYTEYRVVKIENAGSLAFKYTLNIVPTSEVGILADVIDVYYADGEVALTRETLDTAATLVGTLSDVIGGTVVANGTLNPKDENVADSGVVYVTIALKMQESAGNEYMNKSVGDAFDIQLLATQLDYESDSFGDDYDEGLNPEATYVASAAELRDAMKVEGANIILMNDVTVTSGDTTGYGQHMFLANGKSSTIDLNGHNIILSEDASQVGSLFSTANGGSITIKGDGNVEIKNGKAFVAWAMSATDQINVYGGNYSGNGRDGNNAMFYVQDGKIDVYGGKFSYPTAGNDNWGFNARDAVGNKLVIEIHEGALLQHEQFQYGDNTRIQLSEGCTLEETVIDGVTWYKVVKTVTE